MLQSWCFLGKKFNILCYLILMLVSVHSHSYAAKSSLFSQYQIVLPFNLTQPVVAANLLANPGNELLMLGVTTTGERQLAIYALDTNNRVVLMDQMLLENNLFAFDVGDADKNGLQHLYFLSKEQLYQYQFVGHSQEPANTKLTDSNLLPLSKVNSMYLSEQADAIVAVDFARDINNDQLDDFVLPYFEQTNLYLSAGSTAASPQLMPLTLDIPSLLRVEGEKVSFQPRELFFVDMDLDNKTDIVQVEAAQLRVFQQTAQAGFNTKPLLIPLAADIEGINWWDKVEADGQQLDQSQLKHKNVETITDVNGDGLPDLIVRFTQSSGVLDRTNDYEFYYGRSTDKQLSFAFTADTRIQSESTLSDLKYVDLDGDGKQEIMLSAFDLGLSQIISALLSSSIEQEALIFKMDENDHFAAKPTASQDVEITFSLSSGRSGEPMVKAQDINGDKLKDLIFSAGEGEIEVLFASQDGNKLFNKRAQKYQVKVPKNAKSITHSDLNNDGKMDLILHYSRADPSDLLNKVIVLIAN